MNEKALILAVGSITKALGHKKIRKFSGDACSVVLVTDASLERTYFSQVECVLTCTKHTLRKACSNLRALERSKSRRISQTGRAIGDDSHTAFKTTARETRVKELHPRHRSNFTTVEQSGRRNVSAQDVPTGFMMIRNGPHIDLACSRDGPPLCQR